MIRKAFLLAMIALLPETARAQDIALPGPSTRLPDIAFPGGPQDVWPGEAWATGTLPTDAAEEVTALMDKAVAGELGDVMGETRSVVIIHKGRLVAEAYRTGFGPETKQVSWSMAKSFTQALVGRAVALGQIDTIDAAMPSPWPENDPRSQITWRQWLTMTDGLDYKEIAATGLVDNDVVQMMFGSGRYDVVAYASELPLTNEPGTHWNYSTAGFHLLARALQTELGATPPRMAGWIEEALFAPLGMDAQPEFDPAGTFLGGSLIYASARDFARFGYLYLRDGMWNGTRLLPEGWVEFARSKTPADNANVYGAGWWITPPEGVERSHGQAALTCPCDAFHAGGHEGQTIWVVPSKDLVIVRLGLMTNAPENWRALYEWNQEIARAF